VDGSLSIVCEFLFCAFESFECSDALDEKKNARKFRFELQRIVCAF
jgi:hypothetical protein